MHTRVQVERSGGRSRRSCLGNSQFRHSCIRMNMVVRYPRVPRIWVLRLGAWEAYETSFVGVQDDDRMHRYAARVAAKVAHEAAAAAAAAATVDRHV